MKFRAFLVAMFLLAHASIGWGEEAVRSPEWLYQTLNDYFEEFNVVDAGGKSLRVVAHEKSDYKDVDFASGILKLDNQAWIYYRCELGSDRVNNIYTSLSLLEKYLFITWKRDLHDFQNFDILAETLFHLFTSTAEELDAVRGIYDRSVDSLLSGDLESEVETHEEYQGTSTDFALSFRRKNGSSSIKLWVLPKK